MYRIFSFTLAVATIMLAGLSADGAFAASSALDCSAPKEIVRLNASLPHTARAIRTGKALVIVAVGSSSTEGTGSSDARHTYPARLAQELALRWPKLSIRVINSGIRGETAAEMLARFGSDVLAHQPHLVIWQAGSNTLLQGLALKHYVDTVRQGISRLKSAQADVILMNPQFAPMVLAEPAHRQMIDATRALANDLKVGLFRRFAVMRHWVTSGSYRMADIISHDHLHMNDASYSCIAKLLADSVSVAARNGNKAPASP
ncbi:MAG: acyl-CoA thioesterase-1 [Alphaproteobacteria bacterium]|jgi:acyl-CoA thioesterase-1